MKEQYKPSEEDKKAEDMIIDEQNKSSKKEKTREPHEVSLAAIKLYNPNRPIRFRELYSDWDASIVNFLYDNDIRKELLDGTSVDSMNDMWTWLEETINKVGYPPKALVDIYEDAKISLAELNEKVKNLDRGQKWEVTQGAKNALPAINRLAKIISKPELEIT